MWTYPFLDLKGSPVTSCCLLYSAPSVSTWNMILCVPWFYGFPCDIMLPSLLCTFHHSLSYDAIWTYLFHDIVGSPVKSCCLLWRCMMPSLLCTFSQCMRYELNNIMIYCFRVKLLTYITIWCIPLFSIFFFYHFTCLIQCQHHFLHHLHLACVAVLKQVLI